jgi:hypothetical protein
LKNFVVTAGMQFKETKFSSGFFTVPRLVECTQATNMVHRGLPEDYLEHIVVRLVTFSI